MPNRRRNDHPRFPPPPEGIEERRRAMRREDDIETHEIVEKAVEEAPIVSKLLHTSKVVAAVGVICTFVGGVTGALGYKIIGPTEEQAAFKTEIRARVDSNSIRIGNDHQLLLDIKAEVANLQYINCVQLRRQAPELLPDWCPAIGVPARRP